MKKLTLILLVLLLSAPAEGRIWLARETGALAAVAWSDNGGKKWSEAGIPGTESRRSAFPLLWNAPDGSLWVFYTLTEAGAFFDGAGVICARRCPAPDAPSPEWTDLGPCGTGVVTGEPVCLGDRIVVPVALWGRNLSRYGNEGGKGLLTAHPGLDDRRGPGILLSEDGGSSWSQAFGVVKVPELSPARFNDPQLALDGSGRLVMYLRSCGTGWAWKSVSPDGGQTWLPAAKFALNPDSGLSVKRLRSGRLLLVKCARFDNLLYWESEGMFAYLSDDDGRTWYGGLRLDGSHEARDPRVTEERDGSLVITWKREGETLLSLTSEAEIDASTENRETPVRSRMSVFPPKKQAPYAPSPRKNWSGETLRIGTYNIQYRNKLWPKPRLKAVTAILDACQPDVFGAQEPYIGQIEDILEATGNRYAWVGACVDGENRSGSAHYNPIFYLKDKFEVEDWGTVWFTPKAGAPGYDAYSSRMLCWARFVQKSSGHRFYCFNSHFDHIGQEADRMSARILTEAVRDIAGDMPAFLTGDFNSDEKSVPYALITENTWLQDAMLAVGDPENAEYASMSHYKPLETVARNHLHIDHIFYTPLSSRILSWKLITDSDDGAFGSDHLPIIARWKIAN